MQMCRCTDIPINTPDLFHPGLRRVDGDDDDIDFDDVEILTPFRVGWCRKRSGVP